MNVVEDKNVKFILLNKETQNSTENLKVLSKYRRFFLKCLFVSALKDYFIHKKCTGVRFPIDHQTILDECFHAEIFLK